MARSNPKIESRALAHGIHELYGWRLYLRPPLRLYYDNKAAISRAHYSLHHDYTKLEELDTLHQGNYWHRRDLHDICTFQRTTCRYIQGVNGAAFLEYSMQGGVYKYLWTRLRGSVFMYCFPILGDYELTNYRHVIYGTWLDYFHFSPRVSYFQIPCIVGWFS